ncbi:MAG: plastocyanin/azurin family copper-binding protein, partial [Anaerolineales bacterium]|nr:plastocyanin/azurin family copper-binding protein [Anaerolineales bacterium]
AGAPVELTFINEDALEHDFSILEIPVESVSEADPMSAEHEMQMGAEVKPVLHVAAEPGATNHLSFTPTKSGTYEFFCTVAGHKDAGMVGTMVVKAP